MAQKTNIQTFQASFVPILLYEVPNLVENKKGKGKIFKGRK